MASNALLMGTKKQEEQADELLAALSSIATPMATKEEPAKVLPLRRSRFFYRPTLSIEQEVELQKEALKPREIQAFNKEVETRKTKYEEELPVSMQKNIETVREFWLKELAPLTLGAQAGAMQAKDVAQQVLGAAIGEEPFAKFIRMVELGSTMVTARFITKYLKLPKDLAFELAEKINPKREVVFMPPPDGPRNPKPQNPNLSSSTAEE